MASQFRAIPQVSGQADTRPQANKAIHRRWIVSILATSLLALAVLLFETGIRINPADPGTLGYLAVFATLGALRWSFDQPASNRQRIIRDMAEYLALFIAIALVGAVASYPLAALSSGFADSYLYRADLLLHFDWLEWYRTVAAHPVLQMVSRASYAMIYLSPVILLGHHAVVDHRHEAHDFILSVWLSAALTLLGFVFVPAVGPFAYLWHGHIPYLPVSDLWQPDLIPQLRNHSAQVVALGHLVGLVSAPSFHAAAATLVINFASRQPAIRVPLIGLNLAMLFSTPVEGTHYLTDIILGVVVAFVALGAIALLRARITARAHAAPSIEPVAA